jgi:hypothetical protein
MTVTSKDMIFELTLNNRNASFNFYSQAIKSLREMSMNFLAQRIKFCLDDRSQF